MTVPRVKPTRPRPLIGWREWLSLPDLAVEWIKVKVDTGARTSALHAFDIVPFERDGQAWVRFTIHPRQRQPHPSLRAEAPLIDQRQVRSSSGKTTLRPVIRTTVSLGTHLWPIELTLVRRDLMGFRMLLGRRAIRQRFFVHPGRSYLAGPRRPSAPPSIIGQTKDPQ